ncbi:hypothetical protein D3C75_1176710 [compost metagenome]
MHFVEVVEKTLQIDRAHWRPEVTQVSQLEYLQACQGQQDRSDQPGRAAPPEPQGEEPENGDIAKFELCLVDGSEQLLDEVVSQ